jgi:predicted dinucleotide-binding enzyme
MHIGIIGTGDVGTALATGLSRANHEVTLGSRNPSNHTLEGATVTSQAAAIRESEVVILAVPPNVAVELATSFEEALAGATVVDPTNEYPEATAEMSVAERVAEAAPAASVVKAFNTIGFDRMAAPEIDGDRVTMFIAGDATDATETVAGLAADIGFEARHVGGLAAASHLEAMGRFWIDLSQEFGRDIGFRLLQE